MNSEKIILILTDTLHYPEIAQALENMSAFDRKKLVAQLNKIIYEAIDLGKEICKDENDTVFDDGYNEGFNSGYKECKSDFNIDENGKQK
jgi:hypothetical protein